YTPFQSGIVCQVTGLPPCAWLRNASNSSVAVLYLRPSASIWAFSAARAAPAVASFCAGAGAGACADAKPETRAAATSNAMDLRTFDLHTDMGTPLLSVS